MALRATIDVADLPESAFGARSPLWWGNTLMLFIETTMFALLGATYFYLRMNFTSWPPTQPNTQPPLYHPLPNLWASTAVLAVLLASCIPMVITHRGALNMNSSLVRIGLVLSILAGIAACALRFFEFKTIHFSWDDNAYGSIVWMILGMHLFHILAATLEAIVMASYVLRHPLDDKHAVDITLTAIYWYWVTGMWVIFYLIVYWSPRWYPGAPS
jgi:cytochrome c oxidase subunit 3